MTKEEVLKTLDKKDFIKWLNRMEAL